MKTEKENDQHENKTDWILIVVPILICLLIITIWLVTRQNLKDLDPVIRGTYGDMFGGVNALFSGLAFAGLIFTILLQRKELELQRQELIETREELKRTANAQENSERALKKQAENLKISAKLTALNTLVNYYSEVERNDDKRFPSPSFRDAITKKNRYVSRIEELLEAKEDN